jgi:hypothetical protein
MPRTSFVVITCFAFASSPGTMFPQSAATAQTFPLRDTKDLVAQQAKLEEAEYNGRKCVRLTKEADGEALALVKGTDFYDGIIETEFALRTTTPPGVRMPGFIGIAFRARPDASHYELFYVRPGNSRSNDQAMRNHSVQYSAFPDFGWYRLRREWPFTYEADADLPQQTWTKLKIEVAGRAAKLFLNGSDRPTLLVTGMKGEDLHGAIALWGYAGEESYFSNLRITPAPPLPLKNNGEPAGLWDVKCSTDAGGFPGAMKLTRNGTQIDGSWSGAFGDGQSITGVWRDGYVELSFPGNWTKEMFAGKPGATQITLAGWVDGDSASGRMKVEGRADGSWTATRKQ